MKLIGCTRNIVSNYQLDYDVHDPALLLLDQFACKIGSFICAAKKRRYIPTRISRRDEKSQIGKKRNGFIQPSLAY